ncbi:MAG TPA: hypothetical protein VN717_03625, partial [Gemmatimonadaceae bacterium]|nr:hypothetical protein [Gemmatimonadaceae bacterium]
MTLSLDTLRREGDAFHETLSRELYASGAGLKSTAELQPIYARHANILGPEALELTLEAFKGSTEGSEERRSARLLLDWQAESQSGRQLAELDERAIAWESSAVVRVDHGREIPFESVSIELANSTNAAERHMIETARAKVVESELAPIRREHFQRERDITEQLGLAPNYNATFELLSDVSLADLKAECEQFLRDTQSLWDEVLPEFAKRVLGMSASELTRADALALFRAREFDGYFPARHMESSIRKQVQQMG